MLSFGHIDIHPGKPTQAWRRLSSSCIQQPGTLPSLKQGVRLVCISDTHCIHRQITLPEGDILIHTGDVTKVGRMETWVDFLDWFSSQSFRYKILIAGNHDITLDLPFYADNWRRFHRQQENVAEIQALLTEYDDIVYLQDQALQIEGIQFYGSPWQPTFFQWAFNASRDHHIAEKWTRIPAHTDVLLTHGPPLGYGDRCKTGLRAGCAHLLHEVMYRIQPKVHIFGHIHEHYGLFHNQKTQFVNASSCNLLYRYSHSPVIIDM